MAVTVTNNTILIDPRSGKLTREGFLLLSQLNNAVAEATSEFVRLDAEQTLTGKTIDGDTNTLQDIGTASLKNTTGEDAAVVTGTAGANGELAAWNADGDAVGSGIAAADVLVDADIGVSVQAYDADALSASDIGVSVQAFDADALSASDIGVSVQAYAANLTGWAAKTAPGGAAVGTTDTQTLTNKTFGDFVRVAERATDPDDPAEGRFVIWMSDGTASGDDGDVMVKITAGGVTKTATLLDFSAL